jgi:hypothetical protein
VRQGKTQTKGKAMFGGFDLLAGFMVLVIVLAAKHAMSAPYAY